MATGTDTEGLTAAKPSPEAAVVVVAGVVTNTLLVLLTKDCDPGTGSPMFISSSLKIRKCLSYLQIRPKLMKHIFSFFQVNIHDCHPVNGSKRHFLLAQHTMKCYYETTI